ncbi:hypothetical protein [Cryobacterium aureum]|uniref:hypothetical protein n=1 Tax=Cryobacterium aureum TaxID=995037 RepID=UPI000CF480ED|nr:hypothetical protein [Cryobacterium aureum]
MTGEAVVVQPIFISTNAVLLLEAKANRELAVEFEAPGRAEIGFAIESAEYTNDEYFVSTSYEISLLTGAKNVAARLKSTYLIAFSSTIDTDSMTDASALASLQLAAAEALHPYHRELLIQLSERFDIPAHRLGAAFDREMFIEQSQSTVFEEID